MLLRKSGIFFGLLKCCSEFDCEFKLPKFPKTERLHGQKTIDSLFSNGEKWACYPFRIVLEMAKDHSEISPVRFLISVGKRNFKKAVDRNLIKRRTREAYRLNKHRLLDLFSIHSSELEGRKLVVGFIYIGKQIEPYALIEKRMVRALDEVVEKFRQINRLEK